MKYKILAIVIILIISGLLVSVSTSINKQSVGGVAVSSTCYSSNANGVLYPDYIVNGRSTTTLTFESKDSSILDVYLSAKASSTHGFVTVQMESSWNNSDWYRMENPFYLSGTDATTTTYRLANGQQTYAWYPGTVATTTRVFSVHPVIGRYHRATISVGTSSESISSQGAVHTIICAR